MLTIPDLNRLKVFYVVYESRSLTGAARALHVTRSAVSQSLKALEGELQLKLFLRDSKKVIPTKSAERLFHSIGPLLSEVQTAVRELESDQTQAAGHLRIGAPQDFGSTYLTEAIVEFRKKYPGVTFELSLAIPTDLLGRLSEGKLDLAFVDNGDLHAANYPVSITTVMQEKFILVCAKKYCADHVKRPNPKLSDLKQMQFVDYLPHGPVTKIWLKHQFGKAFDPKVSFSAESVRAVLRAAKGGLGLAVVPERLALEEIKAGRLKEICPGNRPLMNQITLARRLERSPTAREDLFVQFFREYSRAQT